MTDFMGYRGKRVIVSGCFSGMGEATAKLLLSLGAEVHGLDFKDCTLDLASFHKTDLREPATIDAAVKDIGGRVDALFNCAGLAHTFPSLDVMKVNYIGTRYLTERVLEHMGVGGAIASISSNGGIGWMQHVPVLTEVLAIEGYDAAVKWCEEHMQIVNDGYGFSKELVILWTMRRSFDLIKRGIRINCITPGPTQSPMMPHIESGTAAVVLDTSMQPINRRSRPDEQAPPLVFLNSDWASYINGVVLPTDGGFVAGVTTGQIDLSAMNAALAELGQGTDAPAAAG